MEFSRTRQCPAMHEARSGNGISAGKCISGLQVIDHLTLGKLDWELVGYIPNMSVMSVTEFEPR